MREGISVRCQRRRFGEQPAEEGFFSLLGEGRVPGNPQNAAAPSGEALSKWQELLAPKFQPAS